MALIEANRLTVTLPGGPDDPPDDEAAAARIRTWLEQQYGYRPPVERMEGHGWSDRWRVGGAPAPGWRFDAVIPRHLGPAPAGSSTGRSRSHHPANKVHVPPVGESRSSATARAARAGSRTSAPRPRPTTAPAPAPPEPSEARPRPAPARPSAGAPHEVALRHRLDTLFPDLDLTRPS